MDRVWRPGLCQSSIRRMTKTRSPEENEGPRRTLEEGMGREGFEPPKREAADLQSASFNRTWIPARVGGGMVQAGLEPAISSL